MDRLAAINKIVISVVAASIVIWFVNRKISERKRLPPTPLIGNTRQVPRTTPWVTYSAWAKQFGDIFYFKTAGRKFVVLNTPKAVFDLLDKRSAIYSDRPVFYFAGEILGFDRGTALLQHNETLKRSRKYLWQTMGPGAAKRYWGLQQYETARFLQRSISEPDTLYKQLRLLAAAFILKIAYGYEVLEKNDPLTLIAEEAPVIFEQAARPGGFLVEDFPWLRFIPEWFPGAGWKKTAREWKHLSDRRFNAGYDWTLEQIKQDKAIPSFLSEHLQQLDPEDAEGREMLKRVAASLYGGGTDTVVSANSSFFLLMSLHPDVQRKAQEEIDRVVGHDRLPNAQDRKDLPYADAIMREVARLNTVVPLCIPHRLREDDVYEGYHFTKDTIFYPNAWHILHDETLFPDPFTFNPDRFMQPAKDEKEAKLRDPFTYAFGYGRRICPGMHLAIDSLFVVIAMSLATLNIDKKKDGNGQDVEPRVEFTTGTVSHPTDFQVELSPRSPHALELIHRAVETGPAHEFRL